MSQYTQPGAVVRPRWSIRMYKRVMCVANERWIGDESTGASASPLCYLITRSALAYCADYQLLPVLSEEGEVVYLVISATHPERVLYLVVPSTLPQCNR